MIPSQSALPIRYSEVFKLTNLGLNPALFKFGVLTFESDKYICIRDEPQGQSTLVIIELQNGFNMQKRPMKAEAAMMHPDNNVIVLRAKMETGAGSVIQVWDLEKKVKLKNVEVTDQVVFWTWTSKTVIGVVTNTAVLHIDVTKSDSSYEKIFDRAPPLQNSQIMGYQTDSDGKWCLLSGISSPDGKTIVGNMQLYFTENKQQQLLQGYAGCFADVPVTDDSAFKNGIFCFAEKKPDSPATKIQIIEIGKPKEGQPKFKKSADISYAPDQANDFPIIMKISEKYGMLFLITKFGYLFIYEIGSCSLIFRERITEDLIFAAVKNTQTDGLLCVNKKGQILSINIDENNLVPYIMNACKHIPDNAGIAFKLAQRFSLPGADALFTTQFNRLLAGGDYAGAAKCAREAPGTLLRNQDTIQKFKTLPSIPGQPQPILIYFSTLLESTKLNAIESLELVKPVLAQGRKNLIEDWIKQDKLTFNDELGDLIKQVDPQLALHVYLKSDNPQRVIQGLIETGQYNKILPYAQQNGINPDFTAILKSIVPTNPEAALGLAKNLCSRENGQYPKIDLNVVVESFMASHRIQETTAFLLEALKGNRPEEGHLHTKLYEINLMAAPQVAEAIFQMNQYTHYDRNRIAKLCEQVGLYHRALENYNDLNDIKRCMLNTHALNPDQIVEFLGRLPPEHAMVCLFELMKSNRQNVQVVAKAAVQYNGKIKTEELIKLFEQFGSFDGIFFFLGSLLSANPENTPEVYFKYIEAAAKLNNVKEVERVIKESAFYDPVKVKDFLKEIKLPDPRPLIYLCDMHGFVDELTRYLYKNKLNKFIEIYLFRVNSAAAPLVLGTLIDLDCEEIYIKQVLNNIRVCPIDQLVDEFEKRNKLRLLQAWLEARMSEGNQTPALHNALAKIYVDTNKDPQTFLINNAFYDSKVVGKYCEERDPHLAFTAYKRAWGTCDAELVALTNKNYLYRLQARYLVERRDLELWAEVLKEDNPHRKSVIEQVVQTALPETKNPDEVAATVKAFMGANLPNELMELLEKIVLHNSDFCNNRDLQNLLILTAIKADKNRVMDYINRLDNYDGPELAGIALEDQYQLYEEAFTIYKKIEDHVSAINVLLEKMQLIDRATEYAEKINQQPVWSKLGYAQLNANLVSQCIDSFIKANDGDTYHMVIAASERENLFEDLVRYLYMARQNIKDPVIDSELVYALAKCNKLAELEEFISGSNSADNQRVGDRCYDEKLYEAGKILFTHAGNNAKLASCLVHLKQYQAALEAAKKANTPKTWKEVNMACVRAKEFRLAALAGSHIIMHPDHLEDLIAHYEKYGFHDELISLLESALTDSKSHMGVFTELGILYAKYHPERLMDHLRTYFQKINIPKLLRACERFQMWQEAVFLYSHYDEFDNAILTMIEHSTSAWKHDLFVQNIQKVANHDLYYKAMTFYLDEEPMLLNDLLKILTNKLDLSKTVTVLKRTGHLPLVVPFLKSVQNQNVSAVNEALNEVYVENEDYESLRASIKEYENFDQVSLAKKIENHELLEFRRISALIYRINQRYLQSINLSKQDELYKDAMETAQESKDPALAEQLLRFLASIDERECFGACLYTCYELIKPDVVLELAWRFGYMEFAMPFFVQTLRELSSRVDVVQKKTDDIQKKEEKSLEQQVSAPLDIDMGMMFPGMGGFGGPGSQFALMPPPGMMAPNMPSMGGFGSGGGGAYGGGGFGQMGGSPNQYGGGPF